MWRSDAAELLNELQEVATKAKMIAPNHIGSPAKILPYETAALEALLGRIHDIADGLLTGLANGDKS